MSEVRIIDTDMIPSLLDGWQATQATTPLDLVPDTSGTAITADRYVPLTTNAVGDWIEYLHPQPQDVNGVYDRIREKLRRQRMEPIEVEEIQPFTDEELSELLFGDG